MATVRAHRRFYAVLMFGTVGYGTAVLFVLQGGPDLALTQFLVETLTLVLFMFVLRRLPANFDRSRERLS
ncbi:MAG: hydrogenase subunit MbhD domain-containing protein [Mycobacteriales bacterium]